MDSFRHGACMRRAATLPRPSEREAKVGGKLPPSRRLRETRRDTPKTLGEGDKGEDSLRHGSRVRSRRATSLGERGDGLPLSRRLRETRRDTLKTLGEGGEGGLPPSRRSRETRRDTSLEEGGKGGGETDMVQEGGWKILRLASRAWNVVRFPRVGMLAQDDRVLSDLGADLPEEGGGAGFVPPPTNGRRCG